MKRLLTLVFLPILLALPLVAQDNAKAEIFGGFQYLREGNVDGYGDGASTFGWNTSATFNVNRHFGITADFSGNYRSETIVNNSLGQGGLFPVQIHVYTYTFGPVVSWNLGGKFKPFVHALFGEAQLKPDGCVIFSGSPDECGSGSYGGAAVMIGGGVDAYSKASRHFAYRVFSG